jgi:hypothetical protein
MTWRRQVVVGDFVADSDGTDFRISRLSGWEGSASVRAAFEERSQQNGAWAATAYNGPRTVVMAGEVEQASRAEAMAILDQLNAIPIGYPVPMVVDDPNVGVRQALVQRTSEVAEEWRSPVRFAYTVSLTATDPLKYGPESFAQTNLASVVSGTGLTYSLAYPLDYGVLPGVTPGGITAPNAGTASYHPRLRIDGPVTNPLVSMVETGDFIRFDGVVAAGQHLDINWGVPRRVTLGDNPVSMRHKVSYSGNWLAVPVGGGSITFSADDADPAATLSVWSYEGAWE